MIYFYAKNDKCLQKFICLTKKKKKKKCVQAHTLINSSTEPPDHNYMEQGKTPFAHYGIGAVRVVPVQNFKINNFSKPSLIQTIFIRICVYFHEMTMAEIIYTIFSHYTILHRTC
jgi:hypothetical protein